MLLQTFPFLYRSRHLSRRHLPPGTELAVLSRQGTANRLIEVAVAAELLHQGLVLMFQARYVIF